MKKFVVMAVLGLVSVAAHASSLTETDKRILSTSLKANSYLKTRAESLSTRLSEAKLEDVKTQSNFNMFLCQKQDIVQRVAQIDSTAKLNTLKEKVRLENKPEQRFMILGKISDDRATLKCYHYHQANLAIMIHQQNKSKDPGISDLINRLGKVPAPKSPK